MKQEVKFRHVLGTLGFIFSIYAMIILASSYVDGYELLSRLFISPDISLFITIIFIGGFFVFYKMIEFTSYSLFPSVLILFGVELDKNKGNKRKKRNEVKRKNTRKS